MSTMTGVRCPLCGEAAPRMFRTLDRNRRMTDDSFTYRRCKACRLIFVEDPPDDLDPYYADEYHGVPDLGAVEGVARLHQHQIDLVTRYVKPGRLIEIGPAFGWFSLLAREAGFDVTAIEMDPTCCQFLREEVGVDAVCTDEPAEVLPALGPARAVVLWQVVEHLRDPWACLTAAAQCLEPNGILVVGTPNPDALSFKVMRGHWPHVDAPRHLWLIPGEVLIRTMQDHEMDLEEIRFDDPDALEWNRFSWERFFHNALPQPRRVQRAGVRLGGAISTIAARAEQRGTNGSTYTAVFRKRAS